MARIPHQSSVLASSEYFPDRQCLEVEFLSGEIYRYSEVPPSVYQNLLNADSKGFYFNTHVRNRFPFQRFSVPHRHPPLTSQEN